MNDDIYYKELNNIQNYTYNSYANRNSHYISNSKPNLNEMRKNYLGNYNKFNNNTNQNHTMNSQIHKTEIERRPYTSNIKSDKNMLEIQERFNVLQNKINYLQNVVTNETSKRITKSNYNNYTYHPRFNTTNGFNPNINLSNHNMNFNPNNTFNNLDNKKLNEIHNQMKSNNPNSSLIKKITGYRTLNTPKNQNIIVNFSLFPLIFPRKGFIF